MQRLYEKLIVWQEAHRLCLAIYKHTNNFPDSEKFNLVSQMRRSSYGITMNLAEGNGRRSLKEKKRYVDIAIGSLEELHYQCLLAKDLGYIDLTIFATLNDQVQRTGYLLHQLSNSL